MKALIVFLISSVSIFANVDIDTEFSNIKDKYHKVEISSEDSGDLSYLISRYSESKTRPKICPLASTENISIVKKIEAIKKLFENDCDENVGAKLQEAFDTAKAIEGNLASTGVDTSEVKDEIDGEKVQSIISGLNDVFSMKNSCEFQKRSFLENSADIVMRFSQLGMLVDNENGLAIAGGGFALSSILRLVHSFFDEDFKFEENKDRMNFINLNCAFYDLRVEIQASGFLDVPTERHVDDAKQLAGLKSLLTKTIKENKEKVIEPFLKDLAELEKKQLLSKNVFILELEKQLNVLQGFLESPITKENDLSENVKMISSVVDIITQRNVMIPLIRNLMNSELNDSVLLNNAFIDTLEGLSTDYKTLAEGSFEKFNNTTRSFLIADVRRVLEVVTSAKAKNTKEFESFILTNGKTVKKAKEEVLKDFYSIVSKYESFLFKVSVIETRLGRINGTREYTGHDDGSEHKVAILSDYENIVGQIYGKWGAEFLEYTAKTSIKLNNTFIKNFSKYANKHLEKDVGGSIVTKDLDTISELDKISACQDALPFRRNWIYAKNLSEQGYDFLVTNKELFHSDVKGIFLGRTNGRKGIHSFKSGYEKIQGHFKSSFYAKKMMDGEEVQEDDFKKYLSRKNYIGKAMLDLHKSESKAQLLQKLIEDYDCKNRNYEM